MALGQEIHTGNNRDQILTGDSAFKHAQEQQNPELNSNGEAPIIEKTFPAGTHRAVDDNFKLDSNLKDQLAKTPPSADTLPNLSLEATQEQRRNLLNSFLKDAKEVIKGASVEASAQEMQDIVLGPVEKDKS